MPILYTGTQDLSDKFKQLDLGTAIKGKGPLIADEIISQIARPACQSTFPDSLQLLESYSAESFFILTNFVPSMGPSTSFLEPGFMSKGI